MIDFSAQLLNLDDEPLHEGEVPVTLGRAASAALVQPFQDETDLSGDEKLRRWELALRVRKAAELALVAEEVALIKKCVAKMYSPLVAGQAWQMLEGTRS